MAHVTCQNYEIFGARVSRDLAGLAHCNRPDFSYRASMARWPTYNFSREKSDVLSVRGPWCRHLCPWDGQHCRASRGSSHRVNRPRVDSSSNLSLALVPPPTYGVENEKSDGSSTHRAPPTQGWTSRPLVVPSLLVRAARRLRLLHRATSRTRALNPTLVCVFGGRRGLSRCCSSHACEVSRDALFRYVPAGFPRRVTIPDPLHEEV